MKKIILSLVLLLMFCVPILNVNARPVVSGDQEGAYVTPKKVSCGNITGIPRKIPELTNDIITIVQVAVPIILVILGSIDLLKGVVAQKEDEIKKGKSILIKRIITAAIIFFIVVAVKLIVSVAADATSSNNIVECIDCFISGVKNCK